jgi:very-short-patch-repair endonuclease
MYPVRRQISPHAAKLRRDMTDVERKFWFAIKNRQLGGSKFRRQATIAPFVADSLCAEARLIVELDGGQHDETGDAGRTTFLGARGYRVWRFWNNEVVENFDGVLRSVAAALAARTE